MRYPWIIIWCFGAALILSACQKNIPDPILKRGEYKGTYKVGSPYKIRNQWYHPKEDLRYDEIGTSSWYGPNFHGKLTANGDIFNSQALTAAHRTLPMPSYIKVTNLENNRQLVLLVNDRGPFAKGRILDVSEKAASILGFKNQGVARVRVQILPGKTRQLLWDLGIGKQSAFMRYQAPSSYTASSTAPIPNFKAVAPMRYPVTKNPLVRQGLTRVLPVEKEAIPQMAPVQSAAPVNYTSPSQHASQYFIQAGAFSQAKNAEKLAYQLLAFGNTNVIPISSTQGTIYKVQIGPKQSYSQAENILENLARIGYNDAHIIHQER